VVGIYRNGLGDADFLVEVSVRERFCNREGDGRLLSNHHDSAWVAHILTPASLGVVEIRDLIDEHLIIPIVEIYIFKLLLVRVSVITACFGCGTTNSLCLPRCLLGDFRSLLLTIVIVVQVIDAPSFSAIVLKLFLRIVIVKVFSLQRVLECILWALL
jgi:hypothetical protein